jgi:hypothetical protein
MFVATLIYGVRPSGQQCQVSIKRLADFFIERGECLAGAQVLKEDTYVDDILASKERPPSASRRPRILKKFLPKVPWA